MTPTGTSVEGVGGPWFVARRLLDARIDGPTAELLVEAVRADWQAGTIRPRVVTAEPPEAQLARTSVPNRPPLHDRPAWATLTLRLRLTLVGPSAVRIRVAPAEVPLKERDLGMLARPEAALPLRPLARRERAGGVELAPADGGAGPRVRVDAGPFNLVVEGEGGRTLLALPLDDVDVHGLLHVPPLALAAEGGSASVSFRLAGGERLYGLGEQFDGLDHRGHEHTLWNSDAWGTTTGAAYKGVPLVLSSRGWGLFLHTPARVVADLGRRSLVAGTLTASEPELDLFVLDGPTPGELLGAYTALTGRATPLPRWALGLWLSRCRYPSAEVVEAVARRVRAERIPCDVLHLDPAWLATPNLNCDFVWNRRDFPDPAGFLGRLAAQHFKVSLWELPYVSAATELYREGLARGYFVAGTDGKAEGIDPVDGQPRGIVDFTNPEAVGWWQTLHRPLLELGVAAFKTDFGEGVPPGARFASGLTGLTGHNLYPLLYNRAVAEVTAAYAAEHGGGATLVWGRSGWAGSQRYPAQWGGDPQTTVEAMRSTLRGGLSWSLSAPGWWSHDIGGFYGPPPSPALYARWAQFGLLSPLARAHGTTPREPWEFGDRALAICRDYARLRYRLIPYLERLGDEATRAGLPVLRPLLLEFPDDPVAPTIEDQYLLGPDLLVAPVFSESEAPVERPLYLPGGADWHDLWTGERHAGGRWLAPTVPLETLPVFVRAGADLTLLPEDEDRLWLT